MVLGSRITQSAMRPACFEGDHSLFRRFCCTAMNEDVRQAIYKATSMMTDEELKAFILTCATAVEKDGKRARYSYSFSWEGKEFLVCKNMFCNTLGLDDQAVTVWLKQAREQRLFLAEPKKDLPVRNWLIEGLEDDEDDIVVD